MSHPPVPGSSADLDRWWDRILPIWHLLFLGLVFLSIVTTAISSLDGTEKWSVVALLTVMAAAYLGLGWRLFENPGGPRAAVYLSITWLAFCGTLVISEGETAAYFLLFALFPQIWAFLATRIAAVTSVAAIAAQALAELHVAGWGWAAVADHMPQVVMQAGLVLLIGLLMIGVIRQAEQRATVIDELEATRSELAETERARGVLAERERLAREIHDTLAQGFTSILTLSQAIEATLDRDPDVVRERLALLERTARENLAEARALVDALAPVDLQDATLAEAVTRVASRFTEATGIPAEVAVEGSELAIPVFAEIVLLRTVQEALTNVRKHAQASWTQITLSFVADGHGLASVTVVDDGAGFEPQQAQGFGLRGMRTRAQQAGGGLEVTSTPGTGAVVRVHVPLGATDGR